MIFTVSRARLCPCHSRIVATDFSISIFSEPQKLNRNPSCRRRGSNAEVNPNG